MELKLTSCAIRSWKTSDIPSLVRHANNRNIWINLRDGFPHPYTESDAAEWIKHASEAIPETHYAIIVGDEAVGAIGLMLNADIHRRSAEIGYWLSEEFWGRGIVTEALRAMTECAFERFDLCRIYACVFEWNPASMRVLEKAGYAFEARLRKSATKDGKTMDEFVYAFVCD